MNSRRLDEDDFDEDGWARFLKKHALDETSTNAALEEAGIMVTIVGLAFTAPTMGLKVVESEMPPVEEPIDITFWLQVGAFMGLGCVVLAFLRMRIKKWLKARRRKKEKFKNLYGPRTQEQISVE